MSNLEIQDINGANHSEPRLAQVTTEANSKDHLHTKSFESWQDDVLKKVSLFDVQEIVNDLITAIVETTSHTKSISTERTQDYNETEQEATHDEQLKAKDLQDTESSRKASECNIDCNLKTTSVEGSSNQTLPSQTHFHRLINVANSIESNSTGVESPADSAERACENDSCTKPKAANNSYRYVCEIDSCAKVFMREGNLRRHLERHKPEVIHVCRVCGRVFMWKLHLNIHLKMHGGMLGVCYCRHCGEHFTNSVKLRVHLLGHGGEKKLECNVCGRRFVHEENFLQHKAKHAEKPDNPMDCDDDKDVEPTFICINCEQTFENKDDLTKHIEKFCPQ